jgi:glycosyltransferase involved in cell wall biosynthesis
VNQEPLVSILIPAYNAASWIGETLRSALAQTWQRKEIIVVDDGSTDDTLQVAKRFESEVVKVVSQPNAGAAAARNRAYSLSAGDYIQWLDADDLLAPQKIARQLALARSLTSKRTLISSGWVYFHFRPHRNAIVPTELWADLTPTEWLFRKMSLNLHMQTATWLVTRELCEAAGPWNTAMVSDDDGEYFCRVLLASCGVRFVPDAMTYYRVANLASLSRVGTSQRKLDALLATMRLHISYLRSLEDSPRTRAACLTYVQTWLVHFLPDRYGYLPQLEKLAAELGGTLREPTLSWKYAWLRRIAGWKAARTAQLVLPRIRCAATIQWDKLLFTLDGRRIS